MRTAPVGRRRPAAPQAHDECHRECAEVGMCVGMCVSLLIPISIMACIHWPAEMREAGGVPTTRPLSGSANVSDHQRPTPWSDSKHFYCRGASRGWAISGLRGARLVLYAGR